MLSYKLYDDPFLSYPSYSKQARFTHSPSEIITDSTWSSLFERQKCQATELIKDTRHILFSHFFHRVALEDLPTLNIFIQLGRLRLSNGTERLVTCSFLVFARQQ